MKARLLVVGPGLRFALPRLAALIACAICSGSVAGCLRDQPVVEPVRYVLHVKRPAPGGGGPHGGVLVERVRVAALFERKPFVYRLNDTRYSSDPNHGFYAPAGVMLRDALIEWMSSSTVFEAVTEYGSEARWLLHTNVEQLYVDARAASEPRAVLVMEFTLHDAGSPELDRSFRERYEAAVPVEWEDRGGWIEAFSECAVEIFGALEGDLGARLAERDGA